MNVWSGRAAKRKQNVFTIPKLGEIRVADFRGQIEDAFQMFSREGVRSNEHIHFCVAPRQMMKRTTIRRLGARAIILSNYSVRALLVSEKKFEKTCPLLRSEKDIIVNREDVLCPSLSGENESVTRLCRTHFID
jgi:hypothetical protein